jgi:Domain of unknown function (DUF4272)
MTTTIDPNALKAESEAQILAFGGRICSWLPLLDSVKLRPIDQIIGRSLVMNALLNIYFEAPIPVIKDWIEAHNLVPYLSISEKAILELENSQLTEQQLIDLYWYIEALWALLWVGNIIETMPFDRGVEDSMTSVCPNLQFNEGPEKFANEMKLRSEHEVAQMLDLHYRLHWWTRDAQLNGYESDPVSLDIMMERRKALEWAMDLSVDWE